MLVSFSFVPFETCSRLIPLTRLTLDVHLRYLDLFLLHHLDDLVHHWVPLDNWVLLCLGLLWAIPCRGDLVWLCLPKTLGLWWSWLSWLSWSRLSHQLMGVPTWIFCAPASLKLFT